MILFPAIDLKDGQCVRLKLGDMVRLGSLDVRIAAVIESEPDTISDRLTFGPRVLVTADQGGNELNHLYVIGTDGKRTDLTPGDKLKAQFAASFPTAALNNVKWYPAVPAGLEEIEGRVLDRIKAAN